MTDFKPGNLVMFTLGRGSYIGTIRPNVSDGLDWAIETQSGTFYADNDMLTLLPDNTPLLWRGDTVQIRLLVEDPEYAGQAGKIFEPGFDSGGETFGYWLDLASGRRGWFPAYALIALGGDRR